MHESVRERGGGRREGERERGREREREILKWPVFVSESVCLIANHPSSN